MQLPHGFHRPRQDLQGTLFREPRETVLANARVSSDELTRWHSSNWLSFNTAIEEFDWREESELLFVRDLARSGLPDAYITRLLEELPVPRRYAHERLAYSFTHGWVEADRPPDPDEVTDENFEDWLSALADNGRCDRLLEVYQLVREALERCEGTPSSV